MTFYLPLVHIEFKASEVAEQLNKKKANIIAREKRVTKMIFLMMMTIVPEGTSASGKSIVHYIFNQIIKV